MPYCAKCGEELPKGARFCLGCGAPIKAPPSAKHPKRVRPPTLPWRIPRLAIGLAIVVAFLIALLALYRPTQEPEFQWQAIVDLGQVPQEGVWHDGTLTLDLENNALGRPFTSVEAAGIIPNALRKFELEYPWIETKNVAAVSTGRLRFQYTVHNPPASVPSVITIRG
ncbi:hypothetical protein ES703_30144 [subsurface metagenome]